MLHGGEKIWILCLSGNNNINSYLLAKVQSSFNYIDNQIQTAASSIYSLVRIWKIRHSGPGCSFVWILWVVYFPVKHPCKIIIIISISVLLRYNIAKNNHVIMATARLLMVLACLFMAFTSKEWLVTNKISLMWASSILYYYQPQNFVTVKIEIILHIWREINRLNVLTSSSLFFENSIYTWWANV